MARQSSVDSTAEFLSPLTEKSTSLRLIPRDFARDVEGCVAVFRDAVRDRSNFDFRMIEGVNHSFDGKHAALGVMMADWIRKH